jgi:hypothetical protein
MKMKLKFVSLSALTTGMLLMSGLLPGCTQADSPKIEVPKNLTELESKIDKKSEPPPIAKKGAGYMKAFDPALKKGR